jgi:putative glutamine amidotransferase
MGLMPESDGGQEPTGVDAPRRVAGSPLVGLTGRGKPAAPVSGLPPSWGDVPVEVHVSEYSSKVAQAGGLPVMLTRRADVAALADRLAALVLTGGADIAPSRYGSPPDPELGAVEPARDEFELELLTAMVALGRPVLGICRGLQLINVWAGGTLHQHVPSHQRVDRGPSELVHTVLVDRTTCLGARYLGEISVNSFHHQTIDRLGDGLDVVGRAPDGVIEMIEHGHHRVAAVQWHPELLDDLDPSFGWLVDQARPG